VWKVKDLKKTVRGTREHNEDCQGTAKAPGKREWELDDRRSNEGVMILQ
jgi:hypothetical protein